MAASEAPRRVAIACQGGGSHAAFAAGVLQRLLGPELRGRFRLLGLSGTSGGAIVRTGSRRIFRRCGGRGFMPAS